MDPGGKLTNYPAGSKITQIIITRFTHVTVYKGLKSTAS